MPWTVSDYVVLVRRSQPAGADGKCAIAFPAPSGGQLWRVESLAVSCNSTTPTELLVYDTTPSATAVPCAGTRSGNLTFGDSDPPLTILEGGSLNLVWSGASEGATASCRAQVVVMAGLPGQRTPVAA